MKPKLLLMGKLPPPYFGPAVATEIILQSGLRHKYDIIHVRTNINATLAGFKRLSFRKIFPIIAILQKLVLHVRREKPDIVLIPISQTTSGFMKDSLFILAALLFPVHLVLQLRGSRFLDWFRSCPFILQRYIKFLLSRADAVLVLSPQLRYLFKPLIQEDKIFVVRNGMDVKPGFLNLAKGDGRKHILYLGNMIPAKGVRDFICALRILQEMGFKAQVHLAGVWTNPVFKNECLELMKSSVHEIAFSQPQSMQEKQKLLESASMLVFTPREPEGLPWVLLEAVAFGLPVIATDQGAITDVVIDGRNGFVVAKRSPEEIADRMALLLTDEELRLQMARESCRRYTHYFTEAHMVQDFVTCFESICNRSACSQINTPNRALERVYVD